MHTYLRSDGPQVRVVGEDEELGRHCFAEADPAEKTNGAEDQLSAVSAEISGLLETVTHCGVQ